MKFQLHTPTTGAISRTAHLMLEAEELHNVLLSVIKPEVWNRSDMYLRRHRSTMGEKVGPNTPHKHFTSGLKQPIQVHLQNQIDSQRLSVPASASDNKENYLLQNSTLAVPISDLVANLMRPSFHIDGMGEQKILFFDGEPITQKDYFCLCYYQHENKQSRLQLQQVRFDPKLDTVTDLTGQPLIDRGLIWSAGLVPLVIDSSPLTAIEIAKHDYDQRQIFGREYEELEYIYDGWYDNWNERVEEKLSAFIKEGRSYASFYHSVLSIDKDNAVHVTQLEGTLPQIAEQMANDGMVSAGLLDSGGSCAIYDAWLPGFLNHGWYYREPRGAVLVFELASQNKISVMNQG